MIQLEYHSQFQKDLQLQYYSQADQMKIGQSLRIIISIDCLMPIDIHTIFPHFVHHLANRNSSLMRKSYGNNFVMNVGEYMYANFIFRFYAMVSIICSYPIVIFQKNKCLICNIYSITQAEGECLWLVLMKTLVFLT